MKNTSLRGVKSENQFGWEENESSDCMEIYIERLISGFFNLESKWWNVLFAFQIIKKIKFWWRHFQLYLPISVQTFNFTQLKLAFLRILEKGSHETREKSGKKLMGLNQWQDWKDWLSLAIKLFIKISLDSVQRLN